MKILKYLLIIIVPNILLAQKTWTLQECVERALEMNISIKQSELDYVGSEIEKKGAIGSFLPNLNVSTNHSWNVGLNQNITTGLLENVTTQFTSMNLNMNVSIYNGLQNVKRLHRANLSILARQYQLEDMSENVALLVALSLIHI